MTAVDRLLTYHAGY